MRLVIGAIGRLKDGPERELYDRYTGRLDALVRTTTLGPLTTVELIEARRPTADARREDEAQRILEKIAIGGVLVALDESGRTMSSDAFARWLGKLRDEGTPSLALAIGGPDGHGAPVLEQATLRLALGPMTLPHGLARVVLAEQLYRAATLLAGHPYHRA